MIDRFDEVFLLKDDKLDPMPSHSMRDGWKGKSLEEALQTFLENYPQIIPGNQIDPDDPPQFVLLGREMPIGSWSLDHLFVDQNGILALVETKLFQNPESRREVIGQIIEYAANSLEFWSGGKARLNATKFWKNKNKNLDEIMLEEFGQGLEIEAFWADVEENLMMGRLRLIIATDELRSEVRKMIEYLNKEMQNAEVLGLEIKFYGKESDQLVLVPRVVGAIKPPLPKPKSWPADKLRESFDGLYDSDLAKRLTKLLDFAVVNGFFAESKSINPMFSFLGKSGKRVISFGEYSTDSIGVFLDEARYINGAEERDKFVGELKALRLFDQNLDVNGKYARATEIGLSELSSEEFNKLLEVLRKYCS